MIFLLWCSAVCLQVRELYVVNTEEVQGLRYSFFPESSEVLKIHCLLEKRRLRFFDQTPRKRLSPSVVTL